MAKSQRNTGATASFEAEIPRESTVSIDDVALHIFCRLYMDSAGREPEHYAERAYKAAEAFAEVARKRLA